MTTPTTSAMIGRWDAWLKFMVLAQADWRLTTYLKLPWKPFINIDGSTEYTLDPTNQQVCLGSVPRQHGKSSRSIAELEQDLFSFMASTAS